MRKVKIKNNFFFSNSEEIKFILGPCQIESRSHAFNICSEIDVLSKKLDFKYVYKSSFDKANRTSHKSKRGVGLKKGLDILAEVREKFNCAVTTDVHDAQQIKIVKEYIDIIQIPAFLSRQTDLLLAAGETQKPVNIKKGQFLSPKDMMKVAEKVSSTGNDNIFLCERGTSFGYNTLINDFRGLEIMAETGYPVIFDATHSVQQPSILGEKSGGERQFIPSLSRAACAIGVSGLFIETHENPDLAPSDGANMLNINDLPNLIPTLLSIDNVIKNIT